VVRGVLRGALSSAENKPPINSVIPQYRP